jgi:hypothetical protein
MALGGCPQGAISARSCGLRSWLTSCFSGRKALTATSPTGGDDLAAAARLHAGAKAVSALAHDFAGLVRPLHETSPFMASRANGREPVCVFVLCVRSFEK